MNLLKQLSEDEFKRWVKASHELYEIIEGRYDAYPLSRNWVQQWLDFGKSIVKKAELDRLDDIIQNFKYEAFGIRDKETKTKIHRQFLALLDHIKQEQPQNIGFMISPYLFTWNFQRFKEYFSRRSNFNLKQYFWTLGDHLETNKKDFQRFENKKLVYDDIIDEAIEDVFYRIQNKLRAIGINQNEPVGTIKILHILAPRYFPLLDNSEAKGLRLVSRTQRASLTVHNYLRWMKRLKVWLREYSNSIKRIEKDLSLSILKLVDEGLYLMSSVKLQTRIYDLGLVTN